MLVQAVKFEEVVEESSKDETIQQVLAGLQSGSNDDIPKEFKPYI